LRHMFETTVARCITDGLVSGQRFAAGRSRGCVYDARPG
jgi:hypothetical protein